MNAWPYIRGGVVAASFLGGILGANRGVMGFGGVGLPGMALAMFAFGIIGMLFVIGIQAFNPRSDAVWAYPNWTLNPFKLRQPLQFFHLGGYFFLLAGVWCCTRVFHRKMMPEGGR